MPQACIAFGLRRHHFWETDTSEGHRIVGEIFSLQLCCLFEGRNTPAETRPRFHYNQVEMVLLSTFA